jgi:hypothetical protein
MAIGLYRVTVNHTSWNGLNVNVFHCSNDNVGPDDFGTVATNLFGAFYTTLESLFPSDSEIAVGQIIDLSTTPVSYVPFDPTPFDLTVSGSRADARQAAMITWRSMVATRRGRGRSFIGPLNVGALDDITGLWSDETITVLGAAADNLISESATDQVAVQVHSNVANARYPITGHHSRRQPATLRSRTLR